MSGLQAKADTPIRIVRDMQFVRVGSRDYVQGVVVLIEALRLATETARTRQALVRRVKFTRRALSNGTLTLVFGAPAGAPQPQDDALIEGEAAGRPFHAIMRFDDRRPIADAVPDEPHPIGRFTPTGDYSATADIAAGDGARFLKAVIEANKRAIQASLPPQAGKPRVEFVEGQDIAYARDDMATPGPVIFENVSARAFGARRYVMNRVRYRASSGAPAALLLNYSVHAE
ncbi:MAG: hypothetical protein F9K38_17055 [Pseudorhodoplanes sp.]|nr:MAG: hypothetical protein F9K38_17055 [Pseudorhodoplanes sp.]